MHRGSFDMRFVLGLLCAGLLLAAANPTSAQSPVLIPGNPALTEEMVGRFTEFFAWAFDVQLTDDQCNVLRNYAIETWRQRKKDDMDTVVTVVGQQIELSKMDKAKRAFIRAQIEPQLLEDMRKQPHDPMARWALAVYGSSHKVLAAGSPPLTRQSTDAFLEALFFMAGEASGQRTRPDEKLQNDWASALAANYSNMSEELKLQIAAMPLFVATMRVAWPEMPEAEKAKLRTAWAGQVQALLPPAGTATSGAGQESVAQMMAKENLRHQMFMSMSNTLMSIHQSNFNMMSNWGGGPYRYMK